jgi:acyl-coenzyme A thioesterase PaaI-like protein
MPESFSSKIKRWKFNFFPAYRGSGGRITYIADDYREIRIRIPLNWRTKNYFGTIYGGSMYSAVDPIYMVMLINILGRDYIVWDRAAQMKFRRPGKETLYAEFIVTDGEIEEIRRELETKHSVDKIYTVKLRDKSGKVHAEVEKTLYIARKPETKETK